MLLCKESVSVFCNLKEKKQNLEDTKGKKCQNFSTEREDYLLAFLKKF